MFCISKSIVRSLSGAIVPSVQLETTSKVPYPVFSLAIEEGTIIASCSKGSLFLLGIRTNIFTIRVVKLSKRFITISSPGDSQSLIV